MFAVIQFSEKNDTGLAVVPKKWICPKENLCMWPPTTGATSSSINNLVTKQTEPLTTWKRYSYSRIFKETGLYFHNFFFLLKA